MGYHVTFRTIKCELRLSRDELADLCEEFWRQWETRLLEEVNSYEVFVHFSGVQLRGMIEGTRFFFNYAHCAGKYAHLYIQEVLPIFVRYGGTLEGFIEGEDGRRSDYIHVNDGVVLWSDDYPDTGGQEVPMLFFYSKLTTARPSREFLESFVSRVLNEEIAAKEYLVEVDDALVSIVGTWKGMTVYILFQESCWTESETEKAINTQRKLKAKELTHSLVYLVSRAIPPASVFLAFSEAISHPILHKRREGIDLNIMLRRYIGLWPTTSVVLEPSHLTRSRREAWALSILSTLWTPWWSTQYELGEIFGREDLRAAALARHAKSFECEMDSKERMNTLLREYFEPEERAALIEKMIASRDEMIACYLRERISDWSRLLGNPAMVALAALFVWDLLHERKDDPQGWLKSVLPRHSKEEETLFVSHLTTILLNSKLYQHLATVAEQYPELMPIERVPVDRCKERLSSAVYSRLVQRQTEKGWETYLSHLCKLARDGDTRTAAESLRHWEGEIKRTVRSEDLDDLAELYFRIKDLEGYEETLRRIEVAQSAELNFQERGWYRERYHRRLRYNELAEEQNASFFNLWFAFVLRCRLFELSDEELVVAIDEFYGEELGVLLFRVSTSRNDASLKAYHDRIYRALRGYRLSGYYKAIIDCEGLPPKEVLLLWEAHNKTLPLEQRQRIEPGLKAYIRAKRADYGLQPDDDELLDPNLQEQGNLSQWDLARRAYEDGRIDVAWRLVDEMSKLVGEDGGQVNSYWDGYCPIASPTDFVQWCLEIFSDPKKGFPVARALEQFERIQAADEREGFLLPLVKRMAITAANFAHSAGA